MKAKQISLGIISFSALNSLISTEARADVEAIYSTSMLVPKKTKILNLLLVRSRFFVKETKSVWNQAHM